jgi:hypothetical protein
MTSAFELCVEEPFDPSFFPRDHRTEPEESKVVHDELDYTLPT